MTTNLIFLCCFINFYLEKSLAYSKNDLNVQKQKSPNEETEGNLAGIVSQLYITLTDYNPNFIYKVENKGLREFFIIPLVWNFKHTGIYMLESNADAIKPIKVYVHGTEPNISDVISIEKNIILTSSDKREIYVSYDLGDNFLSYKFSNNISKIYYSQENELIVVQDSENSV